MAEIALRVFSPVPQPLCPRREHDGTTRQAPRGALPDDNLIGAIAAGLLASLVASVGNFDRALTDLQKGMIIGPAPVRE
jgi:hypothetical protein